MAYHCPECGDPHTQSKPCPAAPTPEQIQRECAKIREQWSEKEHRKRAGKHPKGWTVPRGKLSDRDLDMVE